MTTPNLPMFEALKRGFVALKAGQPETVEVLAEMYDARVHFEDPIQSVDGIEPFLEVNRRLLTRMKDLSFRMEGLAGTDEEFYFSWTMSMTPKVGPTMEVQGVTHIKTQGGKVVYHRDVWDLASLFASALPMGKQVLRTVLRPLA